MNEHIAIIIPAYNPDEKLITLVNALIDVGAKNIIVVNDGSKAECIHIFETVKAAGVRVLNHSVNLGKGRALKNAFNTLLLEDAALVGAVTADADGQHAVTDIIACGTALEKEPTALIMGCRNFMLKNVPKLNRTGNILTSKVMNALCGVKVSDTQTGLRGISALFMKQLMTTQGERFEFETNMLLETKDTNITISEVPIQTIYFPNNPSSHFNVLKDSIRIYSLFVKFAFASLMSSFADIAIFSLLIFLLKPLGLNLYITIATVAARVISGVLNFLINYRQVFKSQKNIKSTALKYCILCVLQMTLSAFLVSSVYTLWPISEIGIKIIVDIFLFFVSYRIQNKYIF